MKAAMIIQISQSRQQSSICSRSWSICHTSEYLEKSS